MVRRSGSIIAGESPSRPPRFSLVRHGYLPVRREYLEGVDKAEEAWHPLFVEALQKQSHVEYLLDVLLSPDMEERAVLIVDYGKEVSNLERRMAELAAQDTAGRRTDHTRSSPAPEH